MMGRVREIARDLPRTYWAANALELFERWGYYGVFNLLALYLTGSRDTGALGFTQMQKGFLMGTVNAILYFLPIITGSIADRISYKKVLVTAFVILSSGYYLMGTVTGYPAVFVTFFYVAIGAALFKPVISATIARTTTEKTSSIGFGFFYMIVNVGGLIGPLVASELREIRWQYVFIMSSAAILINLLIVLLFYREPETGSVRTTFGQSMRQAFMNIRTALKDARLMIFLLIIVGAWTVYWQFFYSLPVFIDQWIDTGGIYDTLYKIWPALARLTGSPEGIIPAEKMITLSALYIVIFQIAVSSLSMRFKLIYGVIAGVLINGTGIMMTMLTTSGWFVIFAILIFAVGEMLFSPKILEYIGRIAPDDKSALYMGTNFLPIALGNFLAGILSGRLYETMSDKYLLLREEIAKWGLDIPPVSDAFTRTDFLNRACELMGMDARELTHYLWLNYYPQKFGLLLMALGIITALALFIFHRAVFRKN